MRAKPPFRRLTDADFIEVARLEAESRFSRRPAKGGRVRALNELHDALASDGQLFESGDLQDQRDAVAHALMAVIDYLTDQGFSAFVTAPLLRPVVALAERESNSIDLMFSQRPRGGRPKAELKQLERTGILAALTECWLSNRLEDDRPQVAKLEEAARNMRGRWFGTVSRAQLETARELVSQESKDHLAVIVAGATSKRLLNIAEKFGADQAFMIMSRILNDTKLPMGAGEGGISKTPPVSSDHKR